MRRYEVAALLFSLDASPQRPGSEPVGGDLPVGFEVIQPFARSEMESEDHKSSWSR
jgi:hypothetical protein